MAALGFPASGCRGAILVAFLTLANAGPAQAGLFDDDEARRQIADMKAGYEARFDQQARAQLDLAGQIPKPSEEIARLRGQIETLHYELETAKKRQQDFYLDLDTRLRKLEPQPGAAVAPEPPGALAGTATPPGAAAKPAADPAAEGREYEAALNHFKANRFKESAAAFATFLNKHPESDLAPNAQFWLGNAWFAQRDCRKAIEAHSGVVAKWPESAKAPEALLGIATCQQEMGNPTGNRRSLETVLTKYPGTPAADTARERLKNK